LLFLNLFSFQLLMNSTNIAIFILVILVILFIRGCSESFEIEPNMIQGGYQGGPPVFELDGPGYPDGY